MANHNRTSLPQHHRHQPTIQSYNKEQKQVKAGLRTYSEYKKLRETLSDNDWNHLEKIRLFTIVPAVRMLMHEWGLHRKLDDCDDAIFYYSCYYARFLLQDIIRERQSKEKIYNRVRAMAPAKRIDLFTKWIRQLETYKTVVHSDGKRWGSVRRFDARYAIGKPIDFVSDSSIAFGYGENPESVILRQESHQSIIHLLDSLSNLNHPRAAIWAAVTRMQLQGQRVTRLDLNKLGLCPRITIKLIKQEALEACRQLLAVDMPWLDASHFEKYDSEESLWRKCPKSTFDERQLVFSESKESGDVTRPQVLCVVKGHESTTEPELGGQKGFTVVGSVSEVQFGLDDHEPHYDNAA